MSGESDLQKLLTGMRAQLNPGRYVFATVADGKVPTGVTPVVTVAEQEGLTLVVRQQEADVAGLAYEAGMGEPGLAQLARAGFHALGLQTFLTAGPKETRAWEIPVGATAPEAAGVIHTDFKRGFIKAEIVSYDDLIAAGSLQAARAAGKARMEGKDYVMRDGDVVEFRFNV